ncbi:MAG TPA: beta-eliminating lyase-related protein [Kouleothrix sp.]|uniref:serine hydroxymethyltransferase n=1 Tax=Kouleothrix sp. TaxID=2779161 RepID=UPI002BEC92CA|nr:beta-eliminating lyase-related protein [Kouleothrix sp.]
MTTTDFTRPWVPAELEAAIEERAAHYRGLGSDALEREVHELLARHEQYMDRECLSLYAGTNVLNPRAARLMGASVGSRPSLGYPGAKYEMGMQHAEQLEIIAAELLKELFGCAYAEFRVGSGSLANLYAYMACTKPGDRIMAFADSAAGHVTHHQAGAAGLYGLEIHDVPYDAARMSIDVAGLRAAAERIRPKLIIVAGSMCLFPYPVAEARAVADAVGAYLMYDAAHMSGLIAGGAFQQPLAEGAHLMTSSTYKSFGGPPSGMILTNEPELARRLDAIAYPGLTANFDLGKTAALIVAMLDLREFGRAYARTCIANAQALAAALAERGCPVHAVAGRGYTESQHVAIHAQAYGGGTAAARVLERANILTSGIELPLPPVPGDFNALRLGTQEITRWGMQPADMPRVAELIARVLVAGEAPERVQPDVVALRRGFQQLHFVRQ